MNIRDLEYLVALAEFNHFQRAAEACHVSQPTLSGQVRKLEDELGLKLLERTTRKVSFTKNGLMLVDQTRAVLRELKILKNMAAMKQNAMPTSLHIGIIPTIAPYLFPHLSMAVGHKFPTLQLYLHEAKTHQLIDLLEKGKIECAIMSRVRETESFVAPLLFEEPMKLAVGKGNPLANRDIISMSELKGQKLLMLDDGNCLRWQVKKYCYQFDADEDTRFQVTNLETIKSMVAANRGMALVPLLAALQDNKGEDIRYLSCINPEPKRAVVLVFRHGDSLRDRYEQLIVMIRNYMENHFMMKIVENI
ncbi:DNA-binding transcriptional regulator OxyR [Acerihabitans sp. KWT182]|uniref:DNA-binding transcriptional regulator OxyR n=1 Tax=Acerihabitans sp. KWT182 TaxID=3157919 RepID=A0AAU7Q692_9GAMM